MSFLLVVAHSEQICFYLQTLFSSVNFIHHDCACQGQSSSVTIVTATTIIKPKQLNESAFTLSKLIQLILLIPNCRDPMIFATRQHFARANKLLRTLEIAFKDFKFSFKQMKLNSLMPSLYSVPAFQSEVHIMI